MHLNVLSHTPHTSQKLILMISFLSLWSLRWNPDHAGLFHSTWDSLKAALNRLQLLMSLNFLGCFGSLNPFTECGFGVGNWCSVWCMVPSPWRQINKYVDSLLHHLLHFGWWLSVQRNSERLRFRMAKRSSDMQSNTFHAKRSEREI